MTFYGGNYNNKTFKECFSLLKLAPQIDKPPFGETEKKNVALKNVTL